MKTMLNDANVIGNFMMFAFIAAWIGFATYWLNATDQCSSDWFAGYLVSMIFLIIGYTIVSLTLCVSAAAGLFLFLGASLTSREEYKTIEDYE